MVSSPAPQPPTVFVIRIWIEPGAGGGSRRGYVEHVATGRRRYFSEIADVVEFIAAWDEISHDGTTEA